MTDADAFARARAAIDAAHAADPAQRDGRAAELVYADHVEHWARRLLPAADDGVILAARAQHLERWVIARDTYPRDRPGYFTWRKAVQARQGARATELLAAAGVDAATTARVAALVAKAAPRGDAAAQVLEDAACLVFLEDELAAFAAAHGDYTRERFIVILRKTWAKMSAAARSAALGLALPEGLAALVREAVG
jgi:tRNAThr (cytosine32-N3)-methyltransferase